MTDFRDYKTASQWSTEINRGASDRLNKKWGLPYIEEGTPLTDAQAAYFHGWETTDEAENKAGRVMK